MSKPPRRGGWKDLALGPRAGRNPNRLTRAERQAIDEWLAAGNRPTKVPQGRSADVTYHWNDGRLTKMETPHD